MRAIVLMNRSAGGPTDRGPSGEELRQALVQAGVEADVRAVAGDDLAAAARRAADERPDAVVAAGGDGTVSAVAQALADGEVPLGVLPTGTLNHFAKDNGLPLGLDEAAAIIGSGRVERRDVGRVNGRVFVNNSSVGVYARALVDRDARRDMHGLSKWPAMALAALKVFNRHPLLPVRIKADGEPRFRRTPLVFVGNNRYELDLFRVGTRSCLTAGELSLYVANTASRWAMLLLGIRAAFGALRQSRDFEAASASHIVIETGSRRAVRVAVDGEAFHLDMPLTYEICPRALPVLVPAAGGAA